jgi:hypothetical protein
MVSMAGIRWLLLKILTKMCETAMILAVVETVIRINYEMEA